MNTPKTCQACGKTPKTSDYIEPWESDYIETWYRGDIDGGTGPGAAKHTGIVNICRGCTRSAFGLFKGWQSEDLTFLEFMLKLYKL